MAAAGARGGDIRTDLLVIGAGSGGLSVAAGAAQMGADVTLLERGRMGGDCLNTGCVPSKALLAAGAMAHMQARSAPFGIAPVQPRVDHAAVAAHVADVIAAIAPHDSQERFESLGVRVIRAEGRFVDARWVAAGPWRIRARRVVVATGSSPLVPPIPGLEEVPFETNETIFGLAEKPRGLLIIGGGPIGLELAQAHARLGAEVTVIEAARALGREDAEAREVVLEGLAREGVRVLEGMAVRRVSGGPGAVEVLAGGEPEGGAGGSVVTGTHLLLAVGRRPSTEGLDLEKAGIATRRGGIVVDQGLRTTNRRVFAIGDVVAGGMQFTHVAGYQAGLVIRSALLGLPVRQRLDHIPRATYTDPELAQVGLTEAEARDRHGSRLQVARFEMSDNDRAVAERRPEGFVKVMVVRGRPVGATIVGAHAGELIGLWALALAKGLKMADIAGMVAPYPTLGEASRRAAGAYFAPRLFQSPGLRRVVGLVQRWLP